MTPNFEQEAESILRQIATHWKRPGDCDLDPAFIAQALRAAYEKGKDEAFKEASCDDCYVVGFEACREAAARVAEECIGRAEEFQDDGLDVAGLIGVNIRALTPTNADKTEGK